MPRLSCLSVSVCLTHTQHLAPSPMGTRSQHPNGQSDNFFGALLFCNAPHLAYRPTVIWIDTWSSVNAVCARISPAPPGGSPWPSTASATTHAPETTAAAGMSADQRAASDPTAWADTGRTSWSAVSAGPSSTQRCCAKSQTCGPESARKYTATAHAVGLRICTRMIMMLRTYECQAGRQCGENQTRSRCL